TVGELPSLAHGGLRGRRVPWFPAILRSGTGERHPRPDFPPRPAGERGERDHGATLPSTVSGTEAFCMSVRICGRRRTSPARSGWKRSVIVWTGLASVDSPAPRDTPLPRPSTATTRNGRCPLTTTRRTTVSPIRAVPRGSGLGETAREASTLASTSTEISGEAGALVRRWTSCLSGPVGASGRSVTFTW